MKRNQLKNILNRKINEMGLKYLLDKRGKKGREVEHQNIRMADYLVPNKSGLSIEEKQQMFAIINRMVKIDYNFPQNNSIAMCCCGEEETMEHIYNCKTLNSEETNIPYNKVFNGNIGEQVEIFRRFQTNMKQREQRITQNIDKETTTNFHAIQKCDPLYNNFVQ